MQIYATIVQRSGGDGTGLVGKPRVSMQVWFLTLA